MVSYIQESKSGDFKPTPEGQHEMICTRIIDLGTQQSDYNGQAKHLRKVLISWEIPGVRTEIDGKDLPALHSERFTWSFHEKANLRKFLENWRGKPFKQEDFSGPPAGFTIRKLLSVPCYAQVMHQTGQNGNTYANIRSIMRHPGKTENWPKPEGELIFFDLDDFSQETFDKLPKRIKTSIAESPEGAHLIHTGAMRYQPDEGQNGGQSNGKGNQHQQATGQQSGGYGHASGGGAPPFDDEIPFAPETRL